MANSIGSRYIDPGSSPQRMAQAEKAIQQLQRAMTNLPKPAVAATFPVGQTRATAGSLHQSNTTQSAIYGQDWTFDEVAGTGPTLSEAANGFITVADAGWYQFATILRIGWASPNVPSWFQISADYDGNTGEFPRWRRLPNSNDSNFAELFMYGPWYLEAGAGAWFGAEWLTDDLTFLDALTIEVTQLG